MNFISSKLIPITISIRILYIHIDRSIMFFFQFRIFNFELEHKLISQINKLENINEKIKIGLQMNSRFSIYTKCILQITLSCIILTKKYPNI